MPQFDETAHSKDALVGVLVEAGAVFRGNTCRCPFHDDHSPSAGIYQSASGKWRYKCHGCDAKGDVFDIEARVRGLSLRQVLSETRPAPKPSTPHVKPKKLYPGVPTLDDLELQIPGTTQNLYRYSEFYAVFRTILDTGKKSFRPAHWTPGIGWRIGEPETGKLPLYNLHEVGKTNEVLVCEGEKCVEALRKAGYTATTSSFGAGNARKSDWNPLAGKTVTIWPDNDEDGAKYADEVISILQTLKPQPIIKRIDPVQLGLPLKGDAADLLGSVA